MIDNVLLIDDVQFFEHEERIQDEFFHTFNSLEWPAAAAARSLVSQRFHQSGKC